MPKEVKKTALPCRPAALCPLRPTHAPETGAEFACSLPAGAAALEARFRLCSSALLSGLLGCQRPHLLRLPGQTLGIQARQRIERSPREWAVAWSPRVLFTFHLREGTSSPLVDPCPLNFLLSFKGSSAFPSWPAFQNPPSSILSHSHPSFNFIARIS